MLFKSLLSNDRRPLLLAVMVVVASTCVTMMAFFSELREWHKSVDKQFHNLASAVTSAFRIKMESHWQELDSLRRFYDGSIHVDRAEFARFVAPVLAYHSDIKTIGWMPRISKLDRASHEAYAREEGFIDYAIRDWDSQEGLVTVIDREDCFPIYYAEPLVLHRALIGSDISLDPEIRGAFTSARESGRLVLTKGFTIVEGVESEYVFFEFLPVYDQVFSEVDGASSKRSLRGVIIVAFCIDEAVKAALKPFDTTFFDVSLSDVSAKRTSVLFYTSKTLADVPELERSEGLSNAGLFGSTDLLHESDISAGNRKWSFAITTCPGFYSDSRVNRHWVILAAGLFITVLLGLLVYSLQARTAYVNSLVEERTRELQRSQAALHDKNILFSKSQEIAHLGSWEFDIATKRLTWSDEVFRIMGVDPRRGKISYEGFLDLVHPEDRSTLDLVYKESVSLGKESYEIEHRIIRQDNGEIRTVYEKCTHEKDESGKIVRSVGMCHDITERKRAEENLRRAQSYISSIIDSMPSVLIGVDYQGLVTQWNGEAQRVTGISVDSAIGKPLINVFPRLSATLELVRGAVDRGQPVAKHMQPYQRGGETRYEDITIYPLAAEGVEGAVIRVDDVTERVRIEEMMVQNEKMLSLGGLAAGMAHEINNPLAAMMQTADVMLKRLSSKSIPANLDAAEKAGTSLEKIHDFMQFRGILVMLANIVESGKRVTTIVKNMLGFARNNSLQASTHRIDSLMEKSIELAATDYDLKKQYDFKLIEIKREYEENLPSINCEASKIQQVLLNILRNGAQAMQEAGIDSPQFIIRTRLLQETKNVRLEIEDNGPGMDEDTRKRVFEPFFTTKPEGSGTGLGLSVCYFIIAENHKGSLSVESEPGQGTKFIIELPLDIESVNRD